VDWSLSYGGECMWTSLLANTTDNSKGVPMKRWFQFGILSTIITGIVIVLFWIVCQIFPLQTLSVHNNPFPVYRDRLHPGEEVVIFINSDKYIKAPAHLTMRFVDEIIYNVPDKVVDRPIGHREAWGSFTSIPANLPPGDYYLEIIFHYPVNIFRMVSIVTRTQKFMVVSK
jgi:hypothetical protein